MRQAWRRLSSGEDQRRGTSARVTHGRSRTPSARVLRQLIVNARSLSKVAFTFLALFRGLAVSPCASFERLTLYHSRVIKQADILRVVLQSCPDLRCIECHRRSPLPFFADIFRSMYAGFAAACLFIAGLLTSASLQGQAREVRILPIFSSSVAFQKNLRTSSKKFLGTGRAAADSKLFSGRIAPSRTEIVDRDCGRNLVPVRAHSTAPAARRTAGPGTRVSSCARPGSRSARGPPRGTSWAAARRTTPCTPTAAPRTPRARRPPTSGRRGTPA